MNMYVLTTLARLSVKEELKYEVPLQVMQSGPSHALVKEKMGEHLERLVEPFKTFGMSVEFTDVLVTFIEDYKEDHIMAKTNEARTALKYIRKHSASLVPLQAYLKKQKKSEKAADTIDLIEQVAAGVKVADEKTLMLGMMLTAFLGNTIEDLL